MDHSQTTLMSPRALTVLTFGTALGCALIAGVFFAFSTFVMRALARLPPAQGIAAMQSINVEAVSRYFMTTLFGTGAACAVLAVWSLLGGHGTGARLRFGGSMLYVVGNIVVTIAFHVPRNDALANLLPDSTEAAVLWSDYVPSWTAGNHVRAAAALVAAALLTLALLVEERTP